MLPLIQAKSIWIKIPPAWNQGLTFNFSSPSRKITPAPHPIQRTRALVKAISENFWDLERVGEYCKATVKAISLWKLNEKSKCLKNILNPMYPVLLFNICLKWFRSRENIPSQRMEKDKKMRWNQHMFCPKNYKIWKMKNRQWKGGKEILSIPSFPPRKYRPNWS